MSHQVKIYTTPTCGYCRAAKDFFKENNVEYTEVNVIEDRAALEEMKNKSKQMGVPVIDIDGEIVVGFDREKLKSLLGV